MGENFERFEQLFGLIEGGYISNDIASSSRLKYLSSFKYNLFKGRSYVTLKTVHNTDAQKYLFSLSIKRKSICHSRR